MKKVVKYFIFCLLLLIPIIKLSADTVESEDISAGTYVIGKYMFTRSDFNEDYDGRLTARHIMLAAKSIEGNTLEDMVIYYKTGSGKWLDSLTGTEINVPDSFEIDYLNLEINISLDAPSVIAEVNDDKLNVYLDSYLKVNEAESNIDGWELYESNSEGSLNYNNNKYDLLYEGKTYDGARLKSIDLDFDNSHDFIARVYKNYNGVKLYSEFTVYTYEYKNFVPILGDFDENNTATVTLDKIMDRIEANIYEPVEQNQSVDEIVVFNNENYQKVWSNDASLSNVINVNLDMENHEIIRITAKDYNENSLLYIDNQYINFLDRTWLEINSYESLSFETGGHSISNIEGMKWELYLQSENGLIEYDGNNYDVIYSSNYTYPIVYYASELTPGNYIARPYYEFGDGIKHYGVFSNEVLIAKADFDIDFTSKGNYLYDVLIKLDKETSCIIAEYNGQVYYSCEEEGHKIDTLTLEDIEIYPTYPGQADINLFYYDYENENVIAGIESVYYAGPVSTPTYEIYDNTVTLRNVEIPANSYEYAYVYNKSNENHTDDDLININGNYYYLIGEAYEEGPIDELSISLSEPCLNCVMRVIKVVSLEEQPTRVIIHDNEYNVLPYLTYLTTSISHGKRGLLFYSIDNYNLFDSWSLYKQEENGNFSFDGITYELVHHSDSFNLEYLPEEELQPGKYMALAHSSNSQGGRSFFEYGELNATLFLSEESGKHYYNIYTDREVANLRVVIKHYNNNDELIEEFDPVAFNNTSEAKIEYDPSFDGKVLFEIIAFNQDFETTSLKQESSYLFILDSIRKPSISLHQVNYNDDKVHLTISGRIDEKFINMTSNYLQMDGYEIYKLTSNGLYNVNGDKYELVYAGSLNNISGTPASVWIPEEFEIDATYIARAYKTIDGKKVYGDFSEPLIASIITY